MTPDEAAEIRARLANLEARISALEPQPVEVRTGVCVMGFPDSSACTEASLYRRRQGCEGEACRLKSSEYYKGYRKVAEADASE